MSSWRDSEFGHAFLGIEHNLSYAPVADSWQRRSVIPSALQKNGKPWTAQHNLNRKVVLLHVQHAVDLAFCLEVVEHRVPNALEMARGQNEMTGDGQS